MKFCFVELGKFVMGLDELDGSILDGFFYCLKNMSNLLDRPVELIAGVSGWTEAQICDIV